MKVLLRSVLVLPFAVMVTMILLLLMVSLIEFADKSLDSKQVVKLPDILMPEAEIQVQRAIEKPEKPKVDETPPPDVPQQDFDNIDGNAEVGEVAAPTKMSTKLDLDIGSGLSATDGEYLPMVKVAPQYPRRALRRGIEGYVVLEYTVTTTGAVKNPVVIEAEPADIFNQSAIDSAVRYKYKPRVIDGKPVEVPGVRTKIVFKMAK